MPINVLLLFTLPGDDTGVVKHTCGNESSYLMCPQLQPPKAYRMCPNYIKEAQKDYKVLSHDMRTYLRFGKRETTLRDT